MKSTKVFDDTKVTLESLKEYLKLSSEAEVISYAVLYVTEDLNTITLNYHQKLIDMVKSEKSTELSK